MTRFCGSASSKPSALGPTIHNAGYAAAGLDFRYVSIVCTALDDAFEIATRSGFRGLSISMPYKEQVLARLDQLNPAVTAIGACNTVCFDEDAVRGYNTDWVAVRDGLAEIGVTSPQTTVVVGAGGAARAIAYACKGLGSDVFVAARNLEAAQVVVAELELAGALSLEDQGLVAADLIANSTPDSTLDSPLRLDVHPEATALFDVVTVPRHPPLVAEAQRRGLAVSPGWRMLVLQALEQFRLYTGAEPPAKAMSDAASTALEAS